MFNQHVEDYKSYLYDECKTSLTNKLFHYSYVSYSLGTNEFGTIWANDKNHAVERLIEWQGEGECKQLEIWE